MKALVTLPLRQALATCQPTPSNYHMPRGFSTCRLHPSDSTLVTAICAVKDSNAIDCNQHQVVTLPPSHSHHVIRMDPATQLRNRAVLDVTSPNRKTGCLLRFRSWPKDTLGTLTIARSQPSTARANTHHEHQNHAKPCETMLVTRCHHLAHY